MLAAAATLSASAGLIVRLVSDRRHNLRLEHQETVRQDAERAENKRKGTIEQYEEAKRNADDQVHQEMLGAFNLWLIISIPIFCVLLYLYFHKGWDKMPLLSTACFIMAIGVTCLSWVKHTSQTQNEVPPLSIEDKQIEIIKPQENLTGTWIKDNEASESMAEVIEMVKLNRLVRTALKLMRGVQIVQTSDMFEFAIFSLVGWFKVREDYPLSGAIQKHKRRDLRRGYHEGRAVVNQAGHVVIELNWVDPYGGSGDDEFWLQNRDTLLVKSTCTIAGKTASYLTVYRRKQ